MPRGQQAGSRPACLIQRDPLFNFPPPPPIPSLKITPTQQDFEREEREREEREEREGDYLSVSNSPSSSAFSNHPSIHTLHSPDRKCILQASSAARAVGNSHSSKSSGVGTGVSVVNRPPETPSRDRPGSRREGGSRRRGGFAVDRGVRTTGGSPWGREHTGRAAVVGVGVVCWRVRLAGGGRRDRGHTLNGKCSSEGRYLQTVNNCAVG